jgi:hypothetical protein
MANPTSANAHLWKATPKKIEKETVLVVLSKTR